MTTAEARFVIELVPADELLPGTDRYAFTKQWSGALAGHSTGVMLSAGDPSTGNAGYVALEVFTGRLDNRDGSFVLQQFGSMTAGDTTLRYAVVPGSSGGELAGLSGTLTLEVAPDGTHNVTLDYALQ